MNLARQLSAVVALFVSCSLVALVAWMRIHEYIGDGAFVACVGFGGIFGLCIFRASDVTELAFSKSASLKLKKAEEIGDQVSVLAEQILVLFEPKPLSEKPFDEAAHRKFMEETMKKIRSLTKR